MSSSFVELPVEEMAHLLGWASEGEWLQIRVLNRRWVSAVACLMEGELSEQISYDGEWSPPLRRKLVRRLLLLSTPLMSAEVLQSVSALHLSASLAKPSCQVSERELSLIADHFPSVERLFSSYTTYMDSHEIDGLPMESRNLLGWGNLTDICLRVVSKLSALTFLNLAWCKTITDARLVEVGKLGALTSLSLHRCEKITDSGLVELSKLGALTSLALTGCYNITDAGLRHISKLRALTSLNLTDCCKIPDAGLVEVAKLEALTSLNLAKCYLITDSGLGALAKLSNLTFLDLSFCRNLTGAGLVELVKLGSLTSLNLWACEKITDAGRQKLQQKMLA
jgi:hypothetical protein